MPDEPKLSPDIYYYPCVVTRVVDGDTVDVQLDLGLSIYTKVRLRLHGIDAPETRGDEREAGKEATRHLSNLTRSHDQIYVRTIKDKRGKYGRYLAVLMAVGDDGIIINLNEKMIADGYAKAYPEG